MRKRVFGYIFWWVCVSGGASDYALVVVENTEEWDSLWSVICGFKRLDQIPKRERERGIYIERVRKVGRNGRQWAR